MMNLTDVIVGIVIVVVCVLLMRVGSGRPIKPTFVRRYEQGDYGSDDPLSAATKDQAAMRLRSPRLFYGTGHDDDELWGGSDGNMTAQERRDAGYREVNQ